jgi:hypothetical protein
MNFVLPTLAISIMYVIFKIIDTKYITKDNIPVKTITKDGLIVFICGAISMFLLEQFQVSHIIGGSKDSLSAFTNAPDF